MGDRDAAWRELDRILETVERLNPRNAKTMPSRLRPQLEILGIDAATKPDFPSSSTTCPSSRKSFLLPQPGRMAQGRRGRMEQLDHVASHPREGHRSPEATLWLETQP